MTHEPFFLFSVRPAWVSCVRIADLQQQHGEKGKCSTTALRPDEATVLNCEGEPIWLGLAQDCPADAAVLKKMLVFCTPLTISYQILHQSELY